MLNGSSLSSGRLSNISCQELPRALKHGIVGLSEEPEHLGIEVMIGVCSLGRAIRDDEARVGKLKRGAFRYQCFALLIYEDQQIEAAGFYLQIQHTLAVGDDEERSIVPHFQAGTVVLILFCMMKFNLHSRI